MPSENGMTFNDLRVGMPIDLNNQRRFGFGSEARIEAVGYDWAVARKDDKSLLLLEEEDLSRISAWDPNKEEEEGY